MWPPVPLWISLVMPHSNPMPACHLCHAGVLYPIKGYDTLHRVSSDCLPVGQDGQLAVCQACGTVQKPIDPTWQATVEKIYSNYQIYHQSKGQEQVVFDQNTGLATSRSLSLLRKLLAHLPLPESGDMLDVGCGNGALLAAMGQLHPGWRLTGTELSNQHQAAILKLPGVSAFHACPAQDVPGQFDLVTLIHVLEHIPDPVAFLTALKNKLTPVGQLLIEVPDHHRNPFDLLIADHSSHFSRSVLGRTIHQAGLHARFVRRDIIAKELTAAGTSDSSHATALEQVDHATTIADIERRIAWLQSLASKAEALAKDHPVGIFGTSIGGTWLGSTLADRASFFVDEDPARQGRPFMGKPVFQPGDVPRDAKVILALPDWLAMDVARRLQGRGVEWVLPEKLED